MIVFNLLACLLAAATTPAYTASLTASIREGQVVHEGPGEDGEGSATVAIASLARPGVFVPARRRRAVAIRVTLRGESHAAFVVASRPGADSRRAECASPVHLGRSVEASFVQAGRNVRVRLVLPYVAAPFVEASDLYPASGPCAAAVRKLVVERTVRASLFDRRHVSLTFLGSRATTEGDIARTTRWTAQLTLVRR